jgi:para-nitrobenzyl esterase
MGWRSVRTVLLLTCLQLGWIGAPAAQSEQKPIAKIQSGLVEGIHFGSNPNGAAFLGVRYAEPPIGELRWKPPQPAPKWSGTRKGDAREFRMVCQQSGKRANCSLIGNCHAKILSP